MGLPRSPLSARALHAADYAEDEVLFWAFSGPFWGLFWAALLAPCCRPQRAQPTRGGGCSTMRCSGCCLGSTGCSPRPPHSSGLCDTTKKYEKHTHKNCFLLSLLLQMNTGGGRTVPNYNSAVRPRLGALSELSTGMSVHHPFLSTVMGTRFWVCGSAAVIGGGWLPRAPHCGSAPRRAAGTNTAPSAATAPGGPRRLCLWNPTKPSPPHRVIWAKPAPTCTVVPVLGFVRPLPTP